MQADKEREKETDKWKLSQKEKVDNNYTPTYLKYRKQCKRSIVTYMYMYFLYYGYSRGFQAVVITSVDLPTVENVPSNSMYVFV